MVDEERNAGDFFMDCKPVDSFVSSVFCGCYSGLVDALNNKYGEKA